MATVALTFHVDQEIADMVDTLCTDNRNGYGGAGRAGFLRGMLYTYLGKPSPTSYHLAKTQEHRIDLEHVTERRRNYPGELWPLIKAYKEGASLSALAREMNNLQMNPPGSKGKWYPQTVQRVLLEIANKALHYTNKTTNTPRRA